MVWIQGGGPRRRRYRNDPYGGVYGYGPGYGWGDLLT